MVRPCAGAHHSQIFFNVTPVMELGNHGVLEWNDVTRHIEGSYGRYSTVVAGSAMLSQSSDLHSSIKSSILDVGRSPIA